MRKNKGITLIALIITILVMLILAAVTINTIVGEDGIIKRAEESAKVSEESEYYERIALSATYGNNGKIDLDDTKENIEKNIGSNAIVTKDDNKLTIKVTGKYGTYEYEIEGNKIEKVENEETDDGINEELGNATEIKKEDPYGKVVTNYKTNSPGYEDDKWEILHVDDTNIYLISTGSVKFDNASYYKNKNGDDYKFYSIMQNEEELENFPAIKAGWLENVTKSGSVVKKMEYNHGDATCWLLDSRNWTEYLNNNYADWVIGAPTAEMLFESYNSRYPENKRTITEITEFGYWTGNYKWDNQSIGSTYNPWFKGYSYWLACPSNYDYISAGRYLEIMDSSGEIEALALYGTGGLDLYKSNFRPVVCLKSSVVLEPIYNEDGITIKEYKIKE